MPSFKILMKTFKFKDGTTLEASDISTVNEIIVTVPLSDVGLIFSQVTPDNLTAVTVDDDAPVEVIFENASVTRDEDNLTITFNNRHLTEEERLQRRISDLEETVTALTIE